MSVSDVDIGLVLKVLEPIWNEKSEPQAVKYLGIGRTSAQTAFHELEERGFIELMQIGHMVGRKATLWRITDQGYDGKQATNDWRKWKPGMSFRKTEKMEVPRCLAK